MARSRRRAARRRRRSRRPPTSDGPQRVPGPADLDPVALGEVVAAATRTCTRRGRRRRPAGRAARGRAGRRGRRARRRRRRSRAPGRGRRRAAPSRRRARPRTRGTVRDQRDAGRQAGRPVGDLDAVQRERRSAVPARAPCRARSSSPRPAPTSTTARAAGLGGEPRRRRPRARRARRGRRSGSGRRVPPAAGRSRPRRRARPPRPPATAGGSPGSTVPASGPGRRSTSGDVRDREQEPPLGGHRAEARDPRGGLGGEVRVVLRRGEHAHRDLPAHRALVEPAVRVGPGRRGDELERRADREARAACGP